MFTNIFLELLCLANRPMRIVKYERQIDVALFAAKNGGFEVMISALAEASKYLVRTTRMRTFKSVILECLRYFTVNDRLSYLQPLTGLTHA